MAGRAHASGQKVGKSAEGRQRRRSFVFQRRSRKVHCTVLEFSRSGEKVQETEEQPFPDCKWEEMEDGEGTKKKKAKRKDGQGLNDKRRREKEDASQIRQEKKPKKKQM